jgi:clan AA aspartic protease (TIGR02281 family)
MRRAILVLAAALAVSTAARATEVPATPATAPAAGPQAAPAAEFTAIEIEKRSAGTFYIAGLIEGFGALDMLVDTGSSYLVLTQPMVDELMDAGRATYSRGLEGRMADGSTRVVPLYRIESVRLGASCWVHDVEAAAFPAGSRTILGMNVLSRLAPFTFSAEPAQLGLAHCQGPPATRSGSASAQPTAP